MIEISEELVKGLNELKKYVFFEILKLVGRVFIIVDYDESVVIGKRGFLPEEKERGLILVFNTKMKFNFDENGITATLIFGNTPEKCYIPVDAIAGVFSPDLRVQLTVPTLKLAVEQKKTSSDSALTEKNKTSEDKGKIIDITKLRKKK